MYIRQKTSRGSPESHHVRQFHHVWWLTMLSSQPQSIPGCTSWLKGSVEFVRHKFPIWHTLQSCKIKIGLVLNKKMNQKFIIATVSVYLNCMPCAIIVTQHHIKTAYHVQDFSDISRQLVIICKIKLLNKRQFGSYLIYFNMR